MNYLSNLFLFTTGSVPVQVTGDFWPAPASSARSSGVGLDSLMVLSGFNTGIWPTNTMFYNFAEVDLPILILTPVLALISPMFGSTMFRARTAGWCFSA